MKTEIIVRFTIAGEHRYPDAKRKSIARQHQHEFGIAVRLEEESPREIEWLDLRDKLIHELVESFPFSIRQNGKFLNFDTLSCEEIAVVIARIVAKYYVRPTSITIDEMDEQCGTTVKFDQPEMLEFSKGTSAPPQFYVT
jgi:6-pyruvoyl-tetrahydropterin synthase